VSRQVLWYAVCNQIQLFSPRQNPTQQAVCSNLRSFKPIVIDITKGEDWKVVDDYVAAEDDEGAFGFTVDDGSHS
jgi:hypothetical protein